jgi:PPOX class probable F420-dependent enzyme
MSIKSIPESHRDLLQAEVATLATIGPDGRPQQTVIWFLEEEGDVALSINTSRQKVKNLIVNPHCSLLILDRENSFLYLEIRGDAEISPDDEYTFASKVGEKYSADLRGFDAPGDSRVVVRIRTSQVNAVNMGG